MERTKKYGVIQLISDDLLDHPAWELIRLVLEEANEAALLVCGDLPPGEEIKHVVRRPDPMDPADYVITGEVQPVLSREAAMWSTAFLTPKE